MKVHNGSQSKPDHTILNALSDTPPSWHPPASLALPSSPVLSSLVHPFSFALRLLLLHASSSLLRFLSSYPSCFFPLLLFLTFLALPLARLCGTCVLSLLLA